MPCEPAGVCERMKLEHPAYPVKEFGGLIFIYMGPPGTEPLLPLYDVLDVENRTDVRLRGMRIWDDYAIGYVRDCNWLQHFENIVDPWHVLVLHQAISGDQFESAMMVGSSDISFEQTSLGVRYKVAKSLPNGNRLDPIRRMRHPERRVEFRIFARRGRNRSMKTDALMSPGWCRSTTNT